MGQARSAAGASVGARGARRRARLTLASTLVWLGVVAALAAPSQAASVFSHLGAFGGAGTGSGQFGQATMPQRMAVHEASGKLYVADRGNNRIQVLNPTEAGLVFGFQIAAPGPVGVALDQDTGDLYVTHGATTAINEVQRISLTGATSGSYTLTFAGQTTAPLAFGSSAADVQAALRSLSSVGGANLTVSGSFFSGTANFTVTFTSVLAGTNVDQITIDRSALNAEATATTTTTTGGLAAASPAIRKFNPNNASNPASYTPDATFVSPTIGTEVGQIGALQAGPAAVPNAGGLAVDPTNGNIVVADVGRNLVQRFDSNGGFLSSFNGCWDGGPNSFCLGFARPTFTSIRDIAVHSNGDVLVADVNGANARVDRFNASGHLVATLSANNNPVANPGLDASAVNSGITLGVNPVTDEAFVSSSMTQFALSPLASRIYHFEGNALVGHFAPPSGFAGFTYGIASRGAAPGRLYVLGGDVPTGYFVAPIARVQMFASVVPPLVSFDQVTSVSGTSAAFAGTIDPKGNTVSWQFRYRPVGSGTWQSVPQPAGAVSGTSEVPVQLTASGLEPNTDYEVKLVGNVSTLVVETATTTFETPPVPPVASTGEGGSLTDAGATITGGVNPRNAQTSYRFEWGLDDSYGNSVPASPRDVGAGAQRVTVKETLTGLAPGTTYHFRVVAENEFGQVHVGDDQVFTTLAEPRPGLGAARAYELVMKTPTGGIPTLNTTGIVAESGDRASYKTPPLIQSPAGYDAAHQRFLAVRDDEGWDVAPVDLLDPSRIGLASGPNDQLSRDLTRVVSETPASYQEDDRNGVEDLYLREPDGRRTWISRSLLQPAGEPQTDSSGQIALRYDSDGMSVDGRVVLFDSQRRLVEADPLASGAGTRIYRWEAGGLTLVSRKPNGTVPPQATLGGPTQVTGYPVSRDGSRIYWTADVTALNRVGTIYAYTQGSEPTEVGPGFFSGAAADGSRMVYHRNGHLYLYDAELRASRDLTGAAGVIGVSRVSETADRIYFVADGVLASGPSPLGDLPSSTGKNLYLAELDEDGDVTRIRLIAPAAGPDVEESAVSPDGSVFAFGSVKPLTGSPTGGYSQLFVYDLKTRSLVCPSCPADGSQPAAGHVNVRTTPSGQDGAGTSWYGGHAQRQYVTDEGRVFFSIRTPLLEADENTNSRDVYEYRNGELRLVSQGAWNDNSAAFEGVGRDGRTAFITSPAALDPRDVEPGTFKLYAARVGGGFAAPVPPPPTCIGDDCQGPASGSGEVEDVASAVVRGTGNAVSEHRIKPCQSLERRARTAVAKAKRLRNQSRTLAKRLGKSRPVRVKKVARKAKRATRNARHAQQLVKVCRRVAK